MYRGTVHRTSDNIDSSVDTACQLLEAKLAALDNEIREDHVLVREDLKLQSCRAQAREQAFGVQVGSASPIDISDQTQGIQLPSQRWNPILVDGRQYVWFDTVSCRQYLSATDKSGVSAGTRHS